MKQKIQSELNEALKYNLSFAGCGFLGIYHVGVAVCFKKFAPQLLLQKISGASAGALAATCLLVDMPLGEMTSDFFRVVNEARSHSLGPFSPFFNIQTSLIQGMSRHLPEDAHLKVNGKLHISLTRVYDGKSVIVSQFNSREDLLDALLCACFIPGFSGIVPPKFHGVRYMDGAFSDNLPTLDENTVTVSPFCGESDICPRDDSSQMFHVNLANTSIELSRQNIYRFIRILFPPKPEILSNMCQQGFDDALHFLHRNHLISCTRCLAIQSTFILSKQMPEHYDPECTTCSHQRDESLVDKSLPESVLCAMEKYIIKNSSSGIFKWFRRPALFLLSIPATIPCDFVYATLSKIIATAPALKNNMWEITSHVLDNLFYLLLPRDGSFDDMDVYSMQIREMYNNDPILKSFDHVTTRRSIADIYPSDHEHESDFEVRGNMLSRRSSSIHSLSLHGLPSNNLQTKADNETLDNLANNTSQHNAIFLYHYMDETDKTMKFNKIFDMTDSDAASMAHSETENNQMLQYDEIFHHDDSDNHIHNQLIPESREMMSDWTCAEIKIDEIKSENLDTMISSGDRSSSVESMDSFYKPEADQSEHEQILSETVMDVLKKDVKNYSIIPARDCNSD